MYTIFYLLFLFVFRALHLQINCSLQSLVNFDKQKQNQVATNHGLHHDDSVAETSFLSGMKQRLLSYIFQGIWNEESDPALVSYCTIKLTEKKKTFVAFKIDKTSYGHRGFFP